MNIPEMRYKIKLALEVLESKDIYTVLLIILVGISSFGLGRLSLLEGKKEDVRITNVIPFETASALSPLLKKETSTPNEAGALSSDSIPPEALPKGGQLVASKGGTKYHFPWCSGAQRISEANKIWFNSIEEARKMGYTPASNCKGLK